MAAVAWGLGNRSELRSSRVETEQADFSLLQQDVDVQSLLGLDIVPGGLRSILPFLMTRLRRSPRARPRWPRASGSLHLASTGGPESTAATR